MRKTKTTLLLTSLFAILLFPAMPQAALEYTVLNLNMVDASQVQNLSQTISLTSIYMGATLMGGCAFGVVVFAVWLLRHIRAQAKFHEYRAWY